MMGDSGAQQIQGPNASRVAATDFLFNRLNQFSPTGSIQYYQPGSAPPGPAQQIGFSPQFLTGAAQQLFGMSPTGGFGPQPQAPQTGAPTGAPQMPVPPTGGAPTPPAGAPPTPTGQPMQQAPTGQSPVTMPTPPTGGTSSTIPTTPLPNVPAQPAPMPGADMWGSRDPAAWAQRVAQYNADPNYSAPGTSPQYNQQIRQWINNHTYTPTQTPTSPVTNNPATGFNVPMPGADLFGSQDPAAWAQRVQQYLTDPNYRPAGTSEEYNRQIRQYIQQNSTNPSNAPYGAYAVSSMPRDLLALENARTSQNANTIAEALRRQNEIANGALPSYVSGLNMGNAPALPTNPEQFRNQTIQSMFQLGAEPLNRQYGRQFDSLEQSLANKGLAIGGEGASRQMSDLFREQAQGMQNLALQSVLAGGQEASRGLGDIMNLRGTSAQEQLQNAGLVQGSRLGQLNELNALLGLPQVGGANLGSFMPTSPTGVTDAYGLQMGGQQFNANMRNQQQAGNNQALGTALSSLIMMASMMSSRTYKNDLGEEDSILEKLDKVPVHRWTYKGEESEHIGPFAEDFNSAFGFDDGKQISIINMLGVILGAIKELSEKVK